MKTASITVTAIMLSFGLGGSAAFAHTQLSASTPANEAVVAQAPDEISLTFSEAVRLTAVSVMSEHANHKLEISLSEPARDFVLSVPALAPGDYTIQWRALSEDTHVMSGEIRFTVSS